MDDRSAAEAMADNDRLIAEFYQACDDFIQTIDCTLQREREQHDALMGQLKKDAA